MTATNLIDQVTDSQLANFAKLIYKVSGITVSPQKKSLLSNRLRRRLKATGIKSFGDYYAHLRKLKTTDPEWDAFLQEITTHETFLFRDENHWKWFRESYLPDLVVQANKGSRRKTLRVWSAACSTGDEAYTIASCIADRLMNCTTWKINIVGSDLGVETVKQAQQGEFNARAMKLVPDGYRRRFFAQKGTEEIWAAKPNLTQWTKFQTHNLLNPIREQPFDIIFLKNVLIYFDTASKRTALEHIVKQLKPGGVLITGAAEGVGGLLDNLDRETPWRHVKPGGPVSSNSTQRSTR